MITVIGTSFSRAFRVLWLLEELGEAYDHVPAQPRSGEVRRYNPSGKIPVLLDNGEAITDSTAIMQYLADKSGQMTYPAGTIERARQDSWTNLLLDEFDACVWAAAKHSFVLPGAMRVRDLKKTLRWEFKRSVGNLASGLGDGPFLMGKRLTVPDIILGHCGRWAEFAKFEISEPDVKAYLERMKSRPAYQKIVAMGGGRG